MSNDLYQAVLQLEQALRYDMVNLEYIKVDQLPVVDGKQVETINGIPFRTHIFEHEADVWVAGVEE